MLLYISIAPFPEMASAARALELCALRCCTLDAEPLSPAAGPPVVVRFTSLERPSGTVKVGKAAGKGPPGDGDPPALFSLRSCPHAAQGILPPPNMGDRKEKGTDNGEGYVQSAKHPANTSDNCMWLGWQRVTCVVIDRSGEPKGASEHPAAFHITEADEAVLDGATAPESLVQFLLATLRRALPLNNDQIKALLSSNRPYLSHILVKGVQVRALAAARGGRP